MITNKERERRNEIRTGNRRRIDVMEGKKEIRSKVRNLKVTKIEGDQKRKKEEEMTEIKMKETI